MSLNVLGCLFSILNNPQENSSSSVRSQDSLQSVISHIQPSSENFPEKIAILSFKAGNGHVATARAMREAIQREHPTTEIFDVDFFDIIRGHSLFEQVEGDTADVVYNRRFADGSLAKTLPGHRQLEARDEALNGKTWQQLFSDYFEKNEIDFLLSTIPVYNNTVAQGLEHYNPFVPYATLYTDYDIYREGAQTPIKGKQRYAICPSEEVKAYCKDIGYEASRLSTISSLATQFDPTVLSQEGIDREISDLGLDPKKKTGIILGGGVGALDYEGIAKALEAAPKDTQYIFVCGRNEKAFNQLQALGTSYPKVVLGFTDKVPYLMKLSDFYLGKAGGLSISEAIMNKLPLVLLNDAKASPLEKLNVHWMEKQGNSVTLNNIEHAGQKVGALFESGQFDQIKTHLHETMQHDPRQQVLCQISKIHTQAQSLDSVRLLPFAA
jgi:hypothetical protein